MSGRALVLAAHGSRRDPSANTRVRRLAETLRQRRLFDEVAVAFHQGEPGFGEVLDELASDEITVVPLMTSVGHYSEVVLPAALANSRRYSAVRLRITPPVGTHPGIAPLVARRVTQLLRDHGLSRSAVSLALVGHGTPRHPQSRAATLELAEVLSRRRVAAQVLAAFLDDEPRLEGLLGRAEHPTVLVLPFLIGGSHAAHDLPRGLGDAPGRRLIVDAPIGTLDGLAEIVVDLARRHAPPPPRFPRRGGRAPKYATGTVHLVGAGPGDPGLITAKGLALLRSADVVVHDRLASPELLREARAGAELADVGKGRGHAALKQEEINALLVAHARAGRTVVRLKGGDPFVFGRGLEELDACREASVPCRVVPGVSSAIAGPAAAGVPVTARGLARSFAVLTGQLAGDAEPMDFVPFAAVDTLVILMGRASLAEVARQLVAAGRDPSTPAACIQSATTTEQRVVRATLETIADAADREGLEAPMVTVIGAVAARAEAALAGVVTRPLSLRSG